MEIINESKKLPKIPDDICKYINHLVSSLEHREKLQIVHKNLMKEILWYMHKDCHHKMSKYYGNLYNYLEKKEIIRLNNLYFECNCCARHQHNKAFIEDDNLRIITKNNTFDPNYKWEGSYKSNYLPDYCGCPCICRKLSRIMARHWLTKKYGQKAVDGENFYLGIRLSKFTIEDIEYRRSLD